VAWWAAALARRLPAGMTVNAVSPGAIVATSFGRDAPAAMRFLMIPTMKLVGPLMGMNGPIDKGARRDLHAAEHPDHDTGRFYATAKRKKLVGPVGIQDWPDYSTDEAAQEAGFEAVVATTGVGLPAEAA
jgi:NAD(P)-dependent dehydrogenase (short-subunit alcohol dehydrogenase family)